METTGTASTEATPKRVGDIDWNEFKEFKATLPEGFQPCHGIHCGHDDCDVGEYLRKKHAEERRASTPERFAQLKEEFVTAATNSLKLSSEYADRYAPYQERIDAIIAEFNEAHVEVKAAVKEAVMAANDAENKLRIAVVDHYINTGEKTIDENLSVRVSKSFKYDAADAIAWAETNAPVLLSKTIDKKGFEKFADGLEFVTKEEKATSVLKGLVPEVE